MRRRGRCPPGVFAGGGTTAAAAPLRQRCFLRCRAPLLSPQSLPLLLLEAVAATAPAVAPRAPTSATGPAAFAADAAPATSEGPAAVVEAAALDAWSLPVLPPLNPAAPLRGPAVVASAAAPPLPFSSLPPMAATMRLAQHHPTARRDSARHPHGCSPVRRRHRSVSLRRDKSAFRMRPPRKIRPRHREALARHSAAVPAVAVAAAAMPRASGDYAVARECVPSQIPPSPGRRRPSRYRCRYCSHRYYCNWH
mmetsp:Transcript_41114/g.124201  ORF Transcript_41114/g.124201 Transcript_41114/m.124201 type:complete len:252 (-) Transcript_41114:1203-1958(-)